VCVIIDTNLAARVLIQDDPEFEPVKAHLFRNKKPRVQIAYGGRLVEELFANLEIRRVMARLVRLGRAKQVRDEKIEEEQRRLLRLGICTSNDIHVIALARAAPARVLISLDRGLHRDFTNPRILANPRGKVYQKRRHAKLLNTPCDIANSSAIKP
jgi:predicted nucleic acid-binding protein